MRIPTAPGEILLEEFMRPLGLSGEALAAELRVPVDRVNEIVEGQGGVSADMALRLARYFGTTPRFWLNLQVGHDLGIAEIEAGDRIRSEIARPEALPRQ